MQINRRLPIGKYFFLGLVATALSLPLLSGCARGPSQEELSALEEKRQAVKAANKQVQEKKAEKAHLERKVAEKKATKKALEEKRAATKVALAEMD